jgi:hypothetical protein
MCDASIEADTTTVATSARCNSGTEQTRKLVPSFISYTHFVLRRTLIRDVSFGHTCSQRYEQRRPG